MSVDLTDVEIPEKNDGDFPVVPNGDHLATITAEEKTSSSGNPMMSCQFKTDKGVVFDNFVLNNQHGKIRLKILCKAVGITDFSDVKDVDLTGLQVIITTEEKWSEHNRRTEAKVTYSGFHPVENSQPPSKSPEDDLPF